MYLIIEKTLRMRDILWLNGILGVIRICRMNTVEVFKKI